MREFVEKMLHAKVECEPVDVSGLPLYLRGLYSFERWTAFGVPFAMAYPIESSTVKTMAKHRNALETALEIPVAFAFESATGYRVERMLEAGLAFVTLGRQVYLPFLGIALNGGEGRAASRQQASIETLSPQAQRLALIALYGDLDGASVTQAASILATAKMTASRAFDELAAVDPSIVATEGRRRVLRPERNKMALWRRLEPYMTSPVAREYRLAYIPDEDLPLGGISALCELSMLQDDPWPTFAATKMQERALGLAASVLDAGFDESEEPACVVQVLRYAPEPAPGCTVDPLSAILSLSADERDDPRVEGEIESILNRVFGSDYEGNR